MSASGTSLPYKPLGPMSPMGRKLQSATNQSVIQWQSTPNFVPGNSRRSPACSSGQAIPRRPLIPQPSPDSTQTKTARPTHRPIYSPHRPLTSPVRIDISQVYPQSLYDQSLPPAPSIFNASMQKSISMPGTGYCCAHQPGNKGCKRFYVSFNTGAFQRGHIIIALFQRNNGPWIAARGQHQVHQEPPHPPVSIYIRMNVDEHEMSQHNANRRFVFLLQQLKEGRYQFAHGFLAGRRMHRAPNVNRAIAITSKIGGLQYPCGYPGAEQSAVP